MIAVQFILIAMSLRIMDKYKPSVNTPFYVSGNLLNKKGFNYRLEMLEFNNIKIPPPPFCKKSKTAEAMEIAI